MNLSNDCLIYDWYMLSFGPKINATQEQLLVRHAVVFLLSGNI